MEERILDEDESRSIKLKRTKDGETDAVDALADEGGRRIPRNGVCGGRRVR